ncbi:MucR family transcriptional regulator (plasmid) [Komagataeibacter intermedius]|uniref:MucR family transcriptional regulator n=1 Tax=Komagataeibacter intermedius TaxID=66229 RepID=UPI00403509A5
MSDEKLIDATTSIVREYLQKNTVALEDLPRLMQAVREGLMGGTSISMPPAPVASSPVETVVEVSAPEKPAIEQVPAIAIDKSVTPGGIYCLEDGVRKSSLARYLETKFNLSPEEYRKKWGLPESYPMTAPGFTVYRQFLAKTMGLGRKFKKPSTPEEKQAQKSRELAYIDKFTKPDGGIDWERWRFGEGMGISIPLDAPLVKYLDKRVAEYRDELTSDFPNLLKSPDHISPDIVDKSDDDLARENGDDMTIAEQDELNGFVFEEPRDIEQHLETMDPALFKADETTVPDAAPVATEETVVPVEVTEPKAEPAKEETKAEETAKPDTKKTEPKKAPERKRASRKVTAVKSK